jgi:hypothetical protein
VLGAAGYQDIVVEPRTMYVDPTRPALVEGFTRNTFTAMVAGVRDDAVAAGLLSAAEFDQGLADLRRTESGTLHYTFAKATAVSPGPAPAPAPARADAGPGGRGR